MGIVAYLCAWPVPAEPVSWDAPTPPGYVGAHAPNARLADLRTIDLGVDIGPEHIAIGPDGKLYAAMTGGALLRMDPDGANLTTYANTGGRVLGFDFDAQGRMIAADAMKGLLAISRRGSHSPAGRSRESRRSDPLCQLDRRRARRHYLLHRRVRTLRARRMGRHARGERARHPRAGRDRPGAWL